MADKKEGDPVAAAYAEVLAHVLGNAPERARLALRDRMAAALHRQMPGCTHDRHGSDCVGMANAVLRELGSAG